MDVERYRCGESMTRNIAVLLFCLTVGVACSSSAPPQTAKSDDVVVTQAGRSPASAETSMEKPEEDRPSLWGRIFGRGKKTEPEKSTDATIAKPEAGGEESIGFWTRLFGRKRAEDTRGAAIFSEDFSEGIHSLRSGGGALDDGAEPLVMFQGKGGQDGRAHPVIWRAALATISFMGLDRVDPYAGRLSSKWFAAEGLARKERIRVDIRIPVGDNLTVSRPDIRIERQRYHRSGVWVDVGSSTVLAERLRDSIYTHAFNELREGQ